MSAGHFYRFCTTFPRLDMDFSLASESLGSAGFRQSAEKRQAARNNGHASRTVKVLLTFEGIRACARDRFCDVLESQFTVRDSRNSTCRRELTFTLLFTITRRRLAGPLFGPTLSATSPPPSHFGIARNAFRISRIPDIVRVPHTLRVTNKNTSDVDACTARRVE